MFGWWRRHASLEQMKSDLSEAFERVRADLEMQRQFLEELHSHHHGFRKNTTVNHHRIADWISYFESSVKKLEKDIRLLEGKMAQDMEIIKGSALALYQEVHDKSRKDMEAFKEEIKRDLEVFVQEKAKMASVTNVDNVDNVKIVMGEPSFDGLSNPEKWLVGVLFNTEAPLSYQQIAVRTGKSVNTVRVYMNQLKFKGFVEESTLPNGTKIFSLRHRAKVKKLYNL